MRVWPIIFFFLIYNIVLVCHTLTWIHHECTCVPHPDHPPTSLPPPPSGSCQCTSPDHPESCIEPGLLIRSTYDNLHVSMPFSHIIWLLDSSTESKRLFYTSVSLLLFRPGYRYHLSKFHIYALVYCIGVFLSGFTLYNRLQFHPPHYNWFKCILFNGWIIFHCVCVPQLCYPFICWWTSRLLPCPGYYKQCCNEHWGTCETISKVKRQPSELDKIIANEANAVHIHNVIFLSH